MARTSVSSLMRQATTAYNQAQAYNDSIESYKFDMSAKTDADYNAYKTYLDKRYKAVEKTDPTKALSIMRTTDSARRSNVSSNISQLSNQVKMGNISNTDKYNAIGGLWQKAIQNGDENLAARLESQLYSLDVTIQNEQQAAARAGEASAKKAVTSARKQMLDQISTDKKLYTEIEKAAKKGETVVINGKTITPTPHMLDQIKSETLASEADIYDFMAANGLDTEDGQYAEKAKAIRNDPEFDAKYSLSQSDLPTKAVTIDPTTGLRSFGKIDYVPDGKGGLELKDKSNYMVQRQYDTKSIDPANLTTFSYPSKSVDGQAGYFDYMRALKKSGNRLDPSGQVMDFGAQGQNMGNNFGRIGLDGMTVADLKTLGESMSRKDASGKDIHPYSDNWMNTAKEWQIPFTNSPTVGQLPGIVSNGLMSAMPGGVRSTLQGMIYTDQQKSLQAAQEKIKQDQLARAEQQRQAQIAAAITRGNQTFTPKTLPVFAPATNPKSTAPISNLMASAPKGSTPQQTVLNQMGKVIDAAYAGQAKAPAPKANPWETATNNVLNSIKNFKIPKLW